MGQTLCTQDQHSGFIQKNQQLKITTLYFTQDPLKNSKKYNSDASKKSNFRPTFSLEQQKSQEQYKQDSYHEDKNQSRAISNLRKIVPNPTLQKLITSKKRQLGQYQNFSGDTDIPIGVFDNKFYQLPNKIAYKGEWFKSQQIDPASSFQIRENDKIHGKGQYYLPDNTYIQTFAKNNKINGQGRLININGDRYEGQFQDNKANGIGRYWQGDIFYNGKFKNNLPHGNGQQCTQLYTFIGQFENGYRKKGKLTWKNTKDDTDFYVYQGQFVNNMIKPNGKLRLNGELTSYDNFHVK